MAYVTDTHPFLWYLAEDKRLSKKAEAVFDKADNGEDIVAIPIIVLAEALRVLEKERLSIKFKDIIHRIENGSNYTLIPLDLAIIKRIEELKNLELHDKIIVASANFINAKLITKDKSIIESGYVDVVW